MGRDQSLAKILKKCAHSRHMWDVWRDWCHFTALALRNSMDRVGWQEREDQYLAIVARYERADIDRFVEAFTVLVAELEAEPRDVLGETYMLLEIASKDMGQVYTPWHLCRLMAEMTMEGAVQQLEEKSFITVNDPTVGGGAMLIAASVELQARGVNPQTQAYWVAQDLSEIAVYQTYIQMSLLGLPGVVIRQNTITENVYEVWPTWRHIFDGWDYRLRAENTILEAECPVVPVADVMVPAMEQLELF